MTTTPLQAAASTPYDKWLDKPTPDSMGEVLSDLEPTLVREVNRYAGPKALLHGKARNIAVAAVRTFDPTRGAKLHSWVTTQLQQLNRYGQKLRPIYVPEATNRQAAELHSVQLRMNEPAKAAESARRALSIAPGHPGAQGLLRQLMQPRR